MWTFTGSDKLDTDKLVEQGELTWHSDPHTAALKAKFFWFSISVLQLPTLENNKLMVQSLGPLLSNFTYTKALWICNIIFYIIFISKCLLFLETLGKKKWFKYSFYRLLFVKYKCDWKKQMWNTNAFVFCSFFTWYDLS